MLIHQELSVLLGILDNMDPYPSRVATLGTITMRTKLSDIYRLVFEKKHAVRSISSIKKYEVGKYYDISMLFDMLGVEEVYGFDIFSNGRTNVVKHDLNDEIPEIYAGEFDLVVDGHTGHHIADRIMCLSNANKLLTIGGHVVHAFSIRPLMGNFQGLNPGLLSMFYSAHGFDSVRLFVCYPFHENTFYEFLGDPRDAFYLKDSDKYLFVFTAKKTDSVCFKPEVIELLYRQEKIKMENPFVTDDLVTNKVAVWGVGGKYRNVIKPRLELEKDRIEVWGLVDSDPKKEGTFVDGKKVCNPQVLSSAQIGGVIIATNDYESVLEEACCLFASRPELIRNTIKLNADSLSIERTRRLRKQLKECMGTV